jgi:hypothetical protein
MGGINSGRRRSVNRGAVEQYPLIDLRILRRARLVQPGECTYDTLYWQYQDLPTLSARIFIDLSDIDDASIRIRATDDGGVFPQRVAIECTTTSFGGCRSYFLCPLSGSRCEQLFLVDGIFASRKAHRLTYASQSEDAVSRARRRVRKLKRQLEGDNRHARSRGRNRYQMMRRLSEAESHAKTLYIDRLRHLYATSGSHRIPGDVC